jgi:hypothetical protein
MTAEAKIPNIKRQLPNKSEIPEGIETLNNLQNTKSEYRNTKQP